MQRYRISTRQQDIDLEFVHDFLSQSYWAKGIPKQTLATALSNSLCFSVLKDTNTQVGFARVITDKATFAYLADVFIVESERGTGLSKWLLSDIASYPELQGLRRMMLATKDAHGLYQQFGFEPITEPEMLMQIWRPNIYK